MSDKIELGKLCGVLQSKFLCLSQSESRTQPCHVRITIIIDILHGYHIFISTPPCYCYHLSIIMMSLVM